MPRGAQQRPQLHLERLGPRQAQPKPAQPLTAGALAVGRPAAAERLPRQARRELIFVDVERPDGDRARAPCPSSMPR